MRKKVANYGNIVGVVTIIVVNINREKVRKSRKKMHNGREKIAIFAEKYGNEK